MADTLPEVRESALEILREAIEDGTIKSLRSAIRVAKQARLTGRDEDDGSVWALDVLRDANLELKSAEGRKRLIEAQKDLIAKRNKCFIRTEPIGKDRFHNRFWKFDGESMARIWAEADRILGEENPSEPEGSSRFVNLAMSPSAMKICAEESEEDLRKPGHTQEDSQQFVKFCRQEFHPTGFSSALSKRYWGCHASESNMRALTKPLDSRGIREKGLKDALKEVWEASRHDTSADAEQEMHTSDQGKGEESTRGDAENDEFLSSGDEKVFAEAIKSAGSVPLSLPEKLATAIGFRVRIREVVDPNKEPVLSNYLNGSVCGWMWTTRQAMEAPDGADDSMPTEDDPSSDERFPIWKVALDGGGDFLLDGIKVLESISRFRKWKSSDNGYVEDDAAYLGYRNSLGRFCGRAADAGDAATPVALARLMVRREQELYAPLKSRTFDNNWGGKSGARNAWITNMRDYCYDLDTVRTGLLTLEDAFFELTGGVPDGWQDLSRSAKDLLDDNAYRFDIELESIEKKITGLWNSAETRAIFLEIISSK